MYVVVVKAWQLGALGRGYLLLLQVWGFLVLLVPAVVHLAAGVVGEGDWIGHLVPAEGPAQGEYLRQAYRGVFELLVLAGLAGLGNVFAGGRG